MAQNTTIVNNQHTYSSNGLSNDSLHLFLRPVAELPQTEHTKTTLIKIHKPARLEPALESRKKIFFVCAIFNNPIDTKQPSLVIYDQNLKCMLIDQGL